MFKNSANPEQFDTATQCFLRSVCLNNMINNYKFQGQRHYIVLDKRPWGGTSNEYSQKCFHREIIKISTCFH